MRDFLLLAALTVCAFGAVFAPAFLTAVRDVWRERWDRTGQHEEYLNALKEATK